ncbi:MAG TPA: S-adenosylmethionine:tRNA ribosyltransferase-isomerase [Acidimicrobiia bacterium]|nr:S-adenosylmethionine:tRNA ribosyltransferase-isomerase [Acidimicrobiia bacterium]
MTIVDRPLEFTVPESRMATTPAERRGAGRDDVRLMVTHRGSGGVEHTRFNLLDHHLDQGDVLVVNVSATVPAAVDARTDDDEAVTVHIASPTSGGLWSVEVRRPTGGGGTVPGPDLDPQTLTLPGDVDVHLLARSPRTPRLWVAAIEGTSDVVAYLDTHGRPIRYADGASRPLSDYQTIFAVEPGSAEMPSAGRPFTPDLVTRLVARGVAVVPITLHAGVSSYEDPESPGEERYEVPAPTATVVNALRAAGGRVVAVGTTVVRALETVANDSGVIHAGKGLTDHIVTPVRGVRAVDGMLTGWHEPRSSHLTMLETLLGRDRLQEVYDEAVSDGYLWHEFGDALAILP